MKAFSLLLDGFYQILYARLLLIAFEVRI